MECVNKSLLSFSVTSYTCPESVPVDVSLHFEYICLQHLNYNGISHIYPSLVELILASISVWVFG